MLIWVIGFSIMGSIGAVATASMLLLFPEAVRSGLVPGLISYATGTLLGAAFLGMMPAGLKLAPARLVSATVLAGIVAFFVLEKFLLWRHGHEAQSNVHAPTGSLILIGDAFHNLIDGVVIAAAFLTSTSLGIAAALAVTAHEVPQEVGDFAILLDSGYYRTRAFVLNSISSFSTLPGAVAAYYSLGYMHRIVPYVLAVSAASFIYIGTTDLIPGLQREIRPAAALRQLVLLMAGIGTIALFQPGQ
ncbi:MAG TPA: ZIP family metal transporter [Gammaproteobacteria bacterium]|nr:ZIP family metal transporter [Gammaproteobacteria bacterium]